MPDVMGEDIDDVVKVRDALADVPAFSNIDERGRHEVAAAIVAVLPGWARALREGRWAYPMAARAERTEPATGEDVETRTLLQPLDDTGMPEPCQPIGCDNGYHVPGCVYDWQSVARLMAELAAANAEVERLRAMVAEYEGDDRHQVEFREDGWTIMHPIACRPNLFACELNQVASEHVAGPPPQGLGRYYCSLTPDFDLILEGLVPP